MSHTIIVRPSLLQIASIPQIPELEQLLVLCCRIENFYPQDICIEWFRNNGDRLHNFTQYGPFSEEHLYKMWTKIQLVTVREDETASFTCRVYHSSFSDSGFQDIVYYINTQGRNTKPFFSAKNNVLFSTCLTKTTVQGRKLALYPNTPLFIHEGDDATSVRWLLTDHPQSVCQQPCCLNVHSTVLLAVITQKKLKLYY